MSPPNLTAPRCHGAIKFALGSSVIAVLWLAVLPRVALVPAIQQRIQWLDERQIDPAVMYYTDLKAMQPILKRLNERQRRVIEPAVKSPAPSAGKAEPTCRFLERKRG